MKTAIVQTTVADEAEAEALAGAVLEARLAACVHILPVRSRFWWNGRIEKGNETLLIFKTAVVQSEPLIAFIRDRHAYAVPEILMFPIGGGEPAYLRWLLDETVAKRGAAVEEIGA